MLDFPAIFDDIRFLRGELTDLLIQREFGFSGGHLLKFSTFRFPHQSTWDWLRVSPCCIVFAAFRKTISSRKLFIPLLILVEVGSFCETKHPKSPQNHHVAASNHHPILSSPWRPNTPGFWRPAHSQAQGPLVYLRGLPEQRHWCAWRKMEPIPWSRHPKKERSWSEWLTHAYMACIYYIYIYNR